MSVTVEKLFYDLEQSMDQWGYLTSCEVPYLVIGCTEESAALQAVLNQADSYISNLQLDSVDIDERINENTFKVIANYTQDNFSSSSSDSDDSSSFAFDTGGGQKRLTKSLSTKRYPSTAPDYGGAIEVDNENNVNGVEITIPVMKFTETHYFRASQVTTTYKKKLADLTGKINSSIFKGYEIGEVLFTGASGSRQGDNSNDDWSITFNFSVSPNASDLQIGTISVDEKLGWDYLWVKYCNDVSEDKKNLIKKPVAVYVEEVYENRDFGELGIGK